MATEVSFTSLCHLTNDNKGTPWLYRLADIKDGELHTPFKSWRTDNYFENRDRLYYNNGPSAVGTVGVWNWTAIPNQSSPGSDYVQSYFMQELSPIRLVQVTAGSPEEVAEQLKNGMVHSQAYLCDTLFYCVRPNKQLAGVLCRRNEFQVVNRTVKLHEQVYSLPYYSFRPADVYQCKDDKGLSFYKRFDLGVPSRHIPVGRAYDMIRSLVLERATWPVFKECVGASRADWKRIKVLVEKICGESLYDTVVKNLKCTRAQAVQMVDEFVLCAKNAIDVGDIDADVLARIAMQHDGLRRLCEEALSQKWEEEHQREIEQAKQETASIRIQAERTADEAKRKCAEAETFVTAAEEKKQHLQAEIEAAQGRLDRILDEIEQCEALGNETQAAVRRKIAEAQGDMAGFIAELSMLLPAAAPAPVAAPVAVLEPKSVDLEYRSAAAYPASGETDLEQNESWEDEYNLLLCNLSSALGVGSEFRPMLAAFLYSAHINHVPLLIAGPSGEAMAEALSAALYAETAGRLTLGNEYAPDAVEEMGKHRDPVVCVRNLFGKGWLDLYPQTFAEVHDKQIVWTHPYTEDLAIEPKGLYNYMMPLFSESFVFSLDASITVAGKRAENFRPYETRKDKPLRLSAFGRLGFSKLAMARLRRVLFDAKCILCNSAREKDMEVLFGLIPCCVLAGRIDILKDVIEQESDLLPEVRSEAARYIGDE